MPLAKKKKLIDKVYIDSKPQEFVLDYGQKMTGLPL